MTKYFSMTILYHGLNFISEGTKYLSYVELINVELSNVELSNVELSNVEMLS